MKMFAGLDIGGKRTAICVMEVGQASLARDSRHAPGNYRRGLGAFLRTDKVGLDVAFHAAPFPFARSDRLSDDLDGRAARGDAIKGRRIKSDRGDAWGLAEMLRTGWFTSVYVKSVDTHRLKALLGARDQLVKVKRSLGNQARGLLRPFGIKLPSRAGEKK